MHGVLAVYVVGSRVDPRGPRAPGPRDLDVVAVVRGGSAAAAVAARIWWGRLASVMVAPYPGLFPSPMYGFPSVASTLVFLVEPRVLVYGSPPRYPGPRALAGLLDRAWLLERSAAYNYWMGAGRPRAAAKNVLRALWFQYVSETGIVLGLWEAARAAEESGLAGPGCYERLWATISSANPSAAAVAEAVEYCYPELPNLAPRDPEEAAETVEAAYAAEKEKISRAQRLVAEYAADI